MTKSILPFHASKFVLWFGVLPQVITSIDSVIKCRCMRIMLRLVVGGPITIPFNQGHIA